MEMLAPFWLCLRLALLLAGLLVPGAGLLRALRLPRSIGSCFAGSALVIYGCALALNSSGAHLSLATLAAAVAVVTLVALWIARRRGTTTPLDAGGEESFFSPFTRLGALTPGAAAEAAVAGAVIPAAEADVGRLKYEAGCSADSLRLALSGRMACTVDWRDARSDALLCCAPFSRCCWSAWPATPC